MTCGPGLYRYIRRVRIAALDLGTNSFHLLVADVRSDGEVEALTREKAMVRLGDVVARRGRLSDGAARGAGGPRRGRRWGGAADVAVETVRGFKLLADAAGATETHACATSAIRQATN